MACCAGEEEGAPPPCGCSLSPRTPAPGVVEASAPDIVPAGELSPALETPPLEPWAAPAPDVALRARAGPLFLLFATFLN
ncbi:MAG: hypothetical protein ACHQPI_13920 [Thermoanaerobaculia bacterium]